MKGKPTKTAIERAQWEIYRHRDLESLVSPEFYKTITDIDKKIWEFYVLGVNGEEVSRAQIARVVGLSRVWVTGRIKRIEANIQLDKSVSDGTIVKALKGEKIDIADTVSDETVEELLKKAFGGRKDARKQFVDSFFKQFRNIGVMATLSSLSKKEVSQILENPKIRFEIFEIQRKLKVDNEYMKGFWLYVIHWADSLKDKMEAAKKMSDLQGLKVEKPETKLNVTVEETIPEGYKLVKDEKWIGWAKKEGGD